MNLVIVIITWITLLHSSTAYSMCVFMVLCLCVFILFFLVCAFVTLIEITYLVILTYLIFYLSLVPQEHRDRKKAKEHAEDSWGQSNVDSRRKEAKNTLEMEKTSNPVTPTWVLPSSKVRITVPSLVMIRDTSSMAFLRADSQFCSPPVFSG